MQLFQALYHAQVIIFWELYFHKRGRLWGYGMYLFEMSKLNELVKQAVSSVQSKQNILRGLTDWRSSGTSCHVNSLQNQSLSHT